MGCGRKCQVAEELNEQQKLVLGIMKELAEPSAAKVIAAGCGLEAKAVSGQLKTLQGKGYVESPARCLYAITATGRTAVSAP